MKCPYCESEDVVEYGSKFITTDIGSMYDVMTYKCYACGKRFEERNIKGCGKQIFRYGDNYPVFNKGDKMKLERGNKVAIRIQVGVFAEGEIINCDYKNDLYRVKYNDGFKDVEEVFKSRDLALAEDEDFIYNDNTIKTNCLAMVQLAKKDRLKFKDMEVMPKAKKDDLIDLWIDLWELLRDKINGKKEIKK